METWLPLGRLTARGREAKRYQQEVLRVREDVKNPNGRTRQRWEVASYLFLTLSLYLLHLSGELASLLLLGGRCRRLRVGRRHTRLPRSGEGPVPC